MTKLSKEFVDTLDIELINVSDVTNDITLNNNSMSTTQNSQNDSPQKAERSNSQNWERKSPQTSDSNSTLTEQNSPHDEENDTSQNTELTTDPEEKSLQNSGLSYSETSQQQVTREPQNTELTTPDPDAAEKSFQISQHSLRTSEQQANGAEPDEALSEKGVTLEKTKDDNLLETASPKPIDEKLKEIVIEKDINYVGTLQELCVKKQLTPPLYGLENVDGPPHCPKFQTYCEVGPHRQVVTSANKKMGKQLAAAKVLECIKMDGDLPDYASSQSALTSLASTTSNITSTTTATDIDDTVTAIANPVGYLQEWCVKNRITPPKYGIEKIEGPPHCPIFYTFCELEQHREIVSSKSKKTGKDLVARKIIMLLK